MLSHMLAADVYSVCDVYLYLCTCVADMLQSVPACLQVIAQLPNTVALSLLRAAPALDQVLAMLPSYQHPPAISDSSHG